MRPTTGGRAHRRKRLRTGALVSFAAGTMLLSACTGGAAGGGSGSDGPAPTTPTTPPVSINVTPAGVQTQINPLQPITVTSKGGKLSKVDVTNADRGTTVSGQFSPDHTSWHSTERLGYNATYDVVASGANIKGRPNRKHSQVATLEPEDTAYPSLVPPPGSSDDVGIGQPLVVQFDKPIEDKAAVERSLKVTSTPNQEGSWYWIDDEHVHYRPKEFWQPGTKVQLHVGIYGKNLGAGVYGDTDRDLTMTVHDKWVAKADGATQQMAIYHNDEKVKTMPISMGKEETPTHVGTHVISAKDRVYTMDSCTYGVCKGDPDYYRQKEYYDERISNSGEFVHENPDSVASQGSSNVSHGCINLNKANASWFYDHFGIGDVVEVVNSGGEELPVYDTYGDWTLSWEEWQQGSELN